MKKILILLLGVFVLVAAISMVSANENSGSIWTTRTDCGNVSQEVNQYAIGEKVYINGNNFGVDNDSEDGSDDNEDNSDEGYDWTITGQPGHASCDPSIVVASGEYMVNSSGAFCFEAYTVNPNDCGEYKVNFEGKKDNYHVDLNAPVVPEFGAIAGLATILGAMGLFFFIRKK